MYPAAFPGDGGGETQNWNPRDRYRLKHVPRGSFENPWGLANFRSDNLNPGVMDQSIGGVERRLSLRVVEIQSWIFGQNSMPVESIGSGKNSAV